jgi:hypothetical protein
VNEYNEAAVITADATINPQEQQPHPPRFNELEPQLEKSGSPLSDHHILKLSLGFLSAEKPKGADPVDVLIVLYLINRRAIDHPIYDSQNTLAEHFGCDLRTISRSLKRLAARKWITRSKWQGHSDGIAVLHDNLPCAEAKKLRITQDAKQLAGGYHRALQGMGRKRFPKGWLKQQLVSAQKVLDLCDGDLALAGSVLIYALSTATHRVQSKKSMYHLHRRWNKIMGTYTEATALTQNVQ